MSETVHHKGAITMLNVDLSKTLEEQAEQVIELIGGVRNTTSFDTAIDQLDDEGYCVVHKYRGYYYKVADERVDAEDEILRASWAPDDGHIEYELRYYDGGASFTEALDIALSRMDAKLGA